MSRAKDLIRAAKLPETVVPVCLQADLVAEFEAAERELEMQQRVPRITLAGSGREREISERIEALRQQMLDHTIDFRLRAMPREVWREFVAQHPPRKGDDGKPVESDKYIGLNVDTFFVSLVRQSVIEPELDAEDWRGLLGDDKQERARRAAAGEPAAPGVLTDRQFDDLQNAAWKLNRHEVDVPFSLAASRILRSEPE